MFLNLYLYIFLFLLIIYTGKIWSFTTNFEIPYMYVGTYVLYIHALNLSLLYIYKYICIYSISSPQSVGAFFNLIDSIPFKLIP